MLCLDASTLLGQSTRAQHHLLLITRYARSCEQVGGPAYHALHLQEQSAYADCRRKGNVQTTRSPFGQIRVLEGTADRTDL